VADRAQAALATPVITGGAPGNGELLPQVRIRHWGRWVAGLVVLAMLALGFQAVAKGDIDYASIPDLLTQPVIIQGLVNTIVLAVLAQGGAVVLGTVVALMRTSSNPVLRWVSWAYIWVFRGLPVLLQILLWYNIALVFPTFTIPVPFTDAYLLDQPANAVMTGFLAALLGLGLNESAYMAEIVRAGLTSVDRGQTEAAKSIGMPPAKVLTRVVLPQAMRVIIPPTGNEFINMLKGTSIASVIGFTELIHAANALSSRSLAVMETLLAVAFWYMVVVSVANVGQYYLERHYNASSRPPSGGSVWAKVGGSLRRPPFVRAAR
jgi:polar amino acid transport system permease protein